jgi:hypothetical protein
MQEPLKVDFRGNAAVLAQGNIAAFASQRCHQVQYVTLSGHDDSQETGLI